MWRETEEDMDKRQAKMNNNAHADIKTQDGDKRTRRKGLTKTGGQTKIDPGKDRETITRRAWTEIEAETTRRRQRASSTDRKRQR